MKKIINIGIIGFGAMGKTHSYSIENLKYFYSPLAFHPHILGVCTTSIEGASRIASTYGFEIATANEDDLIYNEKIQAIHICTPNIYHYDTVKKALLAGKNVYCEKPLCTNATQAYELARIAEEKGLVCNIVFNNRHIAPLMRAKELVDKGRLGRILTFSAEYHHNSCTDRERPAGWKQNSDVCGGGVLFDLGSHVIDLIYYLCGEFESVSGTEQIAYPTRKGQDGNEWQTNADEAFYMTAKLKNGAMGQICASKLSVGANDDLNLYISGERGAIKFSLMQPNYLYFYDATNKTGTLGTNEGYTAIECVGRYPAPASFPAPKAPSGWLRGHVQGIYEFLVGVATNNGIAPSFKDGAHVQAVMEAAYLSARNSSQVTRVKREDEF